MTESITIFRDPHGRYYNVVVDGRVVDGLGPDETLATVACALFDARLGPPYARGLSMQELRDRERETTERNTLRKVRDGQRPPITAELIESIVGDQSDLQGAADTINSYFANTAIDDDDDLPF